CFAEFVAAQVPDCAGHFAGGANIGTVALPNVQQSAVGECPYGFPYGVAAHVERFGEFCFGRDAVAQRPVAFGDGRTQLRDHLVDEPGSTCGIQWHRFTPSHGRIGHTPPPTISSSHPTSVIIVVMAMDTVERTERVQRDRTTVLAGSSLLAVAVVLVALNLRPAITSVGTMLGEAQAALDASATWAGVLTTLPG